jgi:hypothetical protein
VQYIPFWIVCALGTVGERLTVETWRQLR